MSFGEIGSEMRGENGAAIEGGIPLVLGIWSLYVWLLVLLVPCCLSRLRCGHPSRRLGLPRRLLYILVLTSIPPKLLRFV